MSADGRPGTDRQKEALVQPVGAVTRGPPAEATKTGAQEEAPHQMLTQIVPCDAESGASCLDSFTSCPCWPSRRVACVGPGARLLNTPWLLRLRGGREAV